MPKEFERPVLYMSRDTLELFKKLIGVPGSKVANWSMFGLDILFDDSMEYGSMKIEEAPVVSRGNG